MTLTTRPAAAMAAAAVFLAALLMFWAEPLAAKMVLPLLGGSPMVWNTAMVFFQAALLAGYLGAHLLGDNAAGWKRAVLPALLLLAAGAVVLPIGAPGFYPPPPTDRWPVPWLAGHLALAVGLPFVALATVTPLAQRWLARRAGADKDVYRLYGASNLGSLIALLAFPFVLEPLLDTADQTRLWAAGYALLLGLMAALAMTLARAPIPAPRAAKIEPAPAPTGRERLSWLVLALAPASLLFGVTTHITTDVASAPFLWVIPLALYLLSFVAAFSRFGERARPAVVMVQGALLILLALAFPLVIGRGWPLFVLHLAAFFASAWVCHAELYRRRPAPARLTEFYLWLALGGVAGGLFNTLLAPLLFPGAIEYPLALVAAAWLRPRAAPARPASPLTWADFLLPLGAGLLYLATLALRSLERDGLVVTAIAAASGGTVVVAYLCRREPGRFALALGAILAVGAVATDGQGLLARERTFFGVYRVTEQDGVRSLFHGTTIHGVQKKDPAARRMPLGYYHPDGPLGQFFAARASPAPPLKAAFVGLGVGASACHRREHDPWTFYEIDPAVEKIARRWFTYLADCAPEAAVVIGDGRLSLAGEADGALGLIVLDAFNSDAVPVHLLTREALALYFAKLAPEGVLLLHLSNRHLDLAAVAAALAADAGRAGRVQVYNPDATDGGPSAHERSSSIWAIMARDETALGTLALDSRWARLQAKPGARPWTDGFSDLARAIRW